MDLHHFSTIFVQTKNHRILHHRKGLRQISPPQIAKAKVSRGLEMFFLKPECRKLANHPKYFPKSTGIDKAVQMDERKPLPRLPEQVIPHFPCLLR
jgi:hypothetical protein